MVTPADSTGRQKLFNISDHCLPKQREIFGAINTAIERLGTDADKFDQTFRILLMRQCQIVAKAAVPALLESLRPDVQEKVIRPGGLEHFANVLKECRSLAGQNCVEARFLGPLEIYDKKNKAAIASFDETKINQIKRYIASSAAKYDEFTVNIARQIINEYGRFQDTNDQDLHPELLEHYQSFTASILHEGLKYSQDLEHLPHPKAENGLQFYANGFPIQQFKSVTDHSPARWKWPPYPAPTELEGRTAASFTYVQNALKQAVYFLARQQALKSGITKEAQIQAHIDSYGQLAHVIEKGFYDMNDPASLIPFIPSSDLLVSAQPSPFPLRGKLAKASQAKGPQAKAPDELFYEYKGSNQREREFFTVLNDILNQAKGSNKVLQTKATFEMRLRGIFLQNIDNSPIYARTASLKIALESRLEPPAGKLTPETGPEDAPPQGLLSTVTPITRDAPLSTLYNAQSYYDTIPVSHYVPDRSDLLNDIVSHGFPALTNIFEYGNDIENRANAIFPYNFGGKAPAFGPFDPRQSLLSEFLSGKHAMSVLAEPGKKVNWGQYAMGYPTRGDFFLSSLEVALREQAFANHTEINPKSLNRLKTAFRNAILTEEQVAARSASSASKPPGGPPTAASPPSNVAGQRATAAKASTATKKATTPTTGNSTDKIATAATGTTTTTTTATTTEEKKPEFAEFRGGDLHSIFSRTKTMLPTDLDKKAPGLRIIDIANGEIVPLLKNLNQNFKPHDAFGNVFFSNAMMDRVRYVAGDSKGKLVPSGAQQAAKDIFALNMESPPEGSETLYADNKQYHEPLLKTLSNSPVMLITALGNCEELNKLRDYQATIIPGKRAAIRDTKPGEVPCWRARLAVKVCEENGIPVSEDLSKLAGDNTIREEPATSPPAAPKIPWLPKSSAVPAGAAAAAASAASAARVRALRTRGPVDDTSTVKSASAQTADTPARLDKIERAPSETPSTEPDATATSPTQTTLHMNAPDPSLRQGYAEVLAKAESFALETLVEDHTPPYNMLHCNILRTTGNHDYKMRMHLSRTVGEPPETRIETKSITIHLGTDSEDVAQAISAQVLSSLFATYKRELTRYSAPVREPVEKIRADEVIPTVMPKIEIMPKKYYALRLTFPATDEYGVRTLAMPLGLEAKDGKDRTVEDEQLEAQARADLVRNMMEAYIKHAATKTTYQITPNDLRHDLISAIQNRGKDWEQSGEVDLTKDAKEYNIKRVVKVDFPQTGDPQEYTEIVVGNPKLERTPNQAWTLPLEIRWRKKETSEHGIESIVHYKTIPVASPVINLHILDRRSAFQEINKITGHLRTRMEAYPAQPGCEKAAWALDQSTDAVSGRLKDRSDNINRAWDWLDSTINDLKHVRNFTAVRNGGGGDANRLAIRVERADESLLYEQKNKAKAPNIMERSFEIPTAYQSKFLEEVQAEFKRGLDTRYASSRRRYETSIIVNEFDEASKAVHARWMASQRGGGSQGFDRKKPIHERYKAKPDLGAFTTARRKTRGWSDVDDKNKGRLV